MTEFKNLFEKNLKNLELYVPVVARVHGGTHPEFHDVKSVYDTMVEKLKNNEENYDEEFVKLREITSNYDVPGDTCETYEAVYQMLGEMDKVYHA